MNDKIEYKGKFFDCKEDLFTFLHENKSILIAEKKYSIKHCDTISYSPELKDSTADKSIEDPQTFNGNTIKVRSVINTTNIMDSHSDVHMPGIWNKTVKENKNLMLLQEHQMNFASVITDKVKASVIDMNWSDLGYNKLGKTQALVFDSILSKDRNPFMFDQYVRGYVKNHSVGMQYVGLNLAMNDKSFTEEYALWQKHIGDVINSQDAKDKGFFWVVTEAKAIEGSAVVMGSNKITPTLDVSEKNEPDESTHKDNEPSKDTHDFKQTINNFKFI